VRFALEWRDAASEWAFVEEIDRSCALELLSRQPIPYENSYRDQSSAADDMLTATRSPIG
jgi:hypothetical protein